MGWFSKRKKKTEAPPAVKEDIWVKCAGCGAHIYKTEWEKNIQVCPKCNYHGRLTCRERQHLTIDPETFKELAGDVTTSDPLGFVDGKDGSYSDKAEATKKKTGLKEAVLVGHGRLNGLHVAIAIMDFRFFGGSLASGTGQRILVGAQYALKHKLPYIIFSASGGARMQEGMVSLMQMAKTCAGVAQLREAGLPYISVLTDPTTGGVSASFAMVGDINIAEPGAIIGFAGRRVIEQTIKQKLPDGFQKAEYLLEHGFIDRIIDRKDMKDELHRMLLYWQR
ncbi:MAG: acetyl-CoA carboxylase carboxyltransferase subunit beta [Kiritimatiellae bacterium]|nr:acetyl-CoA carboxylase carboxyltransferase subunit beta [Kiritimatiellia bacterium]